MTAFLRNSFLAAVAVSALTGSALADQTVTCSHSNLNDLWSGRCCSAGSADCMGGGNGGHDHNDNGGRGGSTNGAAGKP